MKARDIIQGWPRGRSTSRPWPFEAASFWFMTILRIRSPFDLALMKEEAEADREYHYAQQLMVDRWRAGELAVMGYFPPYIVPPEKFEPGYWTYRLPVEAIEYEPWPTTPHIPAVLWQMLEATREASEAASGAAPETVAGQSLMRSKREKLPL